PSREREILTGAGIDRLMEVAWKYGRYGHRDATAILIAFRHGLRASELCDLQWGQINFQQGTLLVQRVKNGTPSTHYLNGTELRALRVCSGRSSPVATSS